MKNKKQKQKWYGEVKVWLPNLYYIGTLVSLCFILAQVFYARRSIIESSEWEKAKMTIENIERFKLELNKSPLSAIDVLAHGDKISPDFSIPKGWGSPQADTLFSIFKSLFEDGIKDKKEVRKKVREEIERMIDVMNTFAYPIIMGYASEMGSFQNAAGQYHACGAFIMPTAFKTYQHIGLHAKLLYRLWRIRIELVLINSRLENPQEEIFKLIEETELDNMLCFEGTEVTEASLKKYSKKLDGELEKMQKEIEDFRKLGLE